MQYDQCAVPQKQEEDINGHGANIFGKKLKQGVFSNEKTKGNF